MKKITAIFVALALVLSMNVTALAASHVDSESPVYNSESYLYDTLTVAGSGVESVQTFTVYDIENMAKDGELNLGYENSYSTMTSGSVFTIRRFEGIKLYDFLLYCGLDDTLPDSTQVKTIAKDGYDIRFTLGDLRSDEYNRYTHKGAETADETALPIIIAFSSDAIPLVGPTGDEPVYKRFTVEEGFDENADNSGGPLRLIVGQKNSYEFNAPNCSKWLSAIVVGDDNGYVYDRDTETLADNSEPEQTGSWKHTQQSDFRLKIHGSQARGIEYISLSRLESMDSGIIREYFAASGGKNAFEGVTLKSIIEEYLADGIDRPTKITVKAADGYTKSIDVSMVFDGIVSRYQPGKTKDVLLAYAINGTPLVANSDSEGYNGENRYGPVRLVVENTISAWVKNVSEIIIGEDDGFSDMQGYTWAENASLQLKRAGVLTGVGENRFEPKSSIRRGDFALVMSRVFNFPEGDETGFSDVKAGSWWEKAIYAAKGAGVVNGYDGKFMPYGEITRQDAAVMIYRALKNNGNIMQTLESTSYTDADDISGYAKQAVAALTQLGIMQGSGGRFNPKSSITRAETAVLIYRVLQFVEA